MKKARFTYLVRYALGLLLTTSVSHAQNLNYTRVYRALVPLQGDISTINDKQKVAESIVYFDGLGRQTQAVARQNTPQGYDLVNFWVYDAYGRKSKMFMPYGTQATSGEFKASPETDQALFYQNLNGAGDGSNAFSVQVMEDSELQRVLKQGAPGAAWQPDNDPYSLLDRTVKSRSTSNAPTDVFKFSYSPASGMVSLPADNATRFYEVNQLVVKKVIDEHGNDVLEYADKEGRVVCKKVRVNETEYASTYYIYNAYGELVVVMPPEAVNRLATGN